MHVKLVAEVGVGTVAAGVSKAHADVVLISGHDGGTGASPLTSLKHAGAPWELGLAETQQTLLLNGLRDRIVVQTDGQLKTGRDVVIAALLGAEEYGFATAPLVVSGCIMMRVCHLDTCPVGIATQNPELRERFTGKPEFVETFFTYIAEEVREHLAALGFRSLDEAIGQAESLDTSRAVAHWKAQGLDLAPILHVPDLPDGTARRRTTVQDHGLEKALDNELIARSADALELGRPVSFAMAIRNVNRTVGTMLGAEVTRRYGGQGLPDGTIDITLTGSAGQSFGAFLPAGITLRLLGDANDYLGKGLSGGRLVVRPAPGASLVAERNVVAGNVLLYGATGGEVFVRGIVGERFAVRNSGATAVVEGVGDHGCEYMTGGQVVVLGGVGRNFAAGMSGGTAYVLDLHRARVNAEMVDLEDLDEEDVDLLHHLVDRHTELTGSAVGRALLEDWRAACRPVHQGHAARLQERPERPRERARGGLRRRQPRDPDRDHGGLPWLTRRASSPRRGASSRPVAPSTCASWTGTRSTRTRTPTSCRRQAGRCMDCGIPFCHDGCPLGNLIPEWNDLVRRDDWQVAIERLHATNNFPEFTGRLCPAPCEGSCVLGITSEPVTIKQVEVVDHRPGLGLRVGGAAAARAADRQDRGRRRVGAGGARGRAAAHPRRPHGRRARASRRGRRAAALRHPRVQDGEAAPGPAARPDDRGGHPVQDRRRRRGRPRRQGAPRALRRGGPRRRRDRAARPARAGTGARRGPAGDGVPAARQPGGARPGVRGAGVRRGPARRDHRRRRHRSRLPRDRAPAGRRAR